MIGSKCILFCLFLCVYSTTAKSLCQESCSPESAEIRLNEILSEAPVSVLKNLDRVHKHVISTIDAQKKYVLHHTNITGFQSCFVEDFTHGEKASSLKFSVSCPRIAVKSEDCSIEESSIEQPHILRDVRFCYNNYRFDFNIRVKLSSNDAAEQYVNILDSKYELHKIGDESDCLAPLGGLTEDQQSLLNKEFKDEIFNLAANKILKNIDKHLTELHLIDLYRDLDN